jgi:hypothetical protein
VIGFSGLSVHAPSPIDGGPSSPPQPSGQSSSLSLVSSRRLCSRALRRRNGAPPITMNLRRPAIGICRIGVSAPCGMPIFPSILSGWAWSAPSAIGRHLFQIERRQQSDLDAVGLETRRPQHSPLYLQVPEFMVGIDRITLRIERERVAPIPVLDFDDVVDELLFLGRRPPALLCCRPRRSGFVSHRTTTTV